MKQHQHCNCKGTVEKKGFWEVINREPTPSECWTIGFIMFLAVGAIMFFMWLNFKFYTS